MKVNRTMYRTPWVFTFTLSALCIPSLTLANSPLESNFSSGSERIGGGEEAEAKNCQWPSTAFLRLGGSICSAALIHPSVIITARHCVDEGVQPENIRVQFGESGQEVGREVGVKDCDYHGGSGAGTDVAYCILDEKITDIPVTPIAAGCVADAIGDPDRRIAIVGFGRNSDEGGSGTKRWAFTSVGEIPESNDEPIDVGETGSSACGGDSGGPAFIKAEDGTWHVFGVVSQGGGGCGNGSTRYAYLPFAIDWLESSSGYDLTPCYDDDYKWDPSEACGNYLNWAQYTEASWTRGAMHLNRSMSTPAPVGQLSRPTVGGRAEEAPTVVIPAVVIPAVALMRVIPAVVIPAVVIPAVALMRVIPAVVIPAVVIPAVALMRAIPAVVIPAVVIPAVVIPAVALMRAIPAVVIPAVVIPAVALMRAIPAVVSPAVALMRAIPAVVSPAVALMRAVPPVAHLNPTKMVTPPAVGTAEIVETAKMVKAEMERGKVETKSTTKMASVPT